MKTKVLEDPRDLVERCFERQIEKENCFSIFNRLRLKLG